MNNLTEEQKKNLALLLDSIRKDGRWDELQNESFKKLEDNEKFKDIISSVMYSMTGDPNRKDALREQIVSYFKQALKELSFVSLEEIQSLVK